jgi:hypothetical protein
MIDLEQRGANDLEVIIFKLKQRTTNLERLILDQEKEIKDLNEKLKDQIKSNN